MWLSTNSKSMSEITTAKPRLFFDKGTICIENSGLLRIPGTKYDERNKMLRSYALNYSEIVEYLKRSDLDFVDHVPNFCSLSSSSSSLLSSQSFSPQPPLPLLQARKLVLRDYQRQAIENWEKSSMKGCVILPTGAGKTAIGIKAIEKTNVATLIVVPTIDLMEQWEQSINEHLIISYNYGHDQDDGGGEGDYNNNSSNDKANNPKKYGNVEVGRLGGGEENIQAITVATYDSAYLRAPEIGNQFELVIFDEVHHLPAPGYRSIAEQLVAPYRLGLTATLEREDGLHELIPYLTGGVVFHLGPQELAAQKHLAEYTIDRIRVSLTPQEQDEYEVNYSRFLTNLRKLGFKVPSMHNLRKLIMMSNRNKVARDAMLARNKANEIALNSKAKINELQKILQQNKNTKTIIFTQNNKMVYNISDRFLVPFITHKTIKDERRDVLSGFKSGRYNVVVTSRVLDEGVDVPDAELGIIISGTGSGRELIQRLGRLLRPKQDGRKAKMIEVVSKHTRETSTSAKRLASLKKSTAPAIPTTETEND